MTEPTISVVTPSLNQGQFIEAAILSVLGQSCPGVEHIIQDGGSTDGTAGVLDRYAGHDGVRVFRERDRGQSDALNRGFRKARGRVIGWLNSDDRYVPGAFVSVLRFFEDHPDAAVVCGDCEAIGPEGAVLWRLPSEEPSTGSLLAHVHRVRQPSVFFRRAVFDAVGHLDESLHYAMDYEFWIRLSLQYRIHYMPTVLSQFRVDSESKTGGGFHAWMPEVVRIMRQYKRQYPRPFRGMRRQIAERRYAAWVLWQGVWQAHRENALPEARRLARAAGLAWLPSVNRYHRLVEFGRGCIAWPTR